MEKIDEILPVEVMDKLKRISKVRDRGLISRDELASGKIDIVKEYKKEKAYGFKRGDWELWRELVKIDIMISELKAEALKVESIQLQEALEAYKDY